MHPIKSQEIKEKEVKYVFITGGVISGLGKGITTASTALLLKSAGYKVSTLKVDMYLNLDAGTINPYEHGEVFVTHDGAETDQDLGNYERFLNQNVYRHNYMTMGQVYYDVITRERQFEYAGQDIEGHIHIPNEVIRRINETAKKDDADIILIEVGGTVGEYQNVMFFEAMRRLKQKKPQSVFIVHVVYLLKPDHLGELKSKPAQSSVYELYKLGLQPDFLICRSSDKIKENKKNLIAFNVGIEEESVIAAPNVKSVYEIPQLYKAQKLDTMLLTKMGFDKKTSNITAWEDMVKNIDKAKKQVKIAIVGKYFNFGESVLEDAYICVLEAIKHASWKLGAEPTIQWFDVERFEKEGDAAKIKEELASYDGIIVPQGWGSRGVEGKINCVQFARENKIPYLGLCFGMQMAVIEYARNVLKLKGANSQEVDENTEFPVIHIMPNQKEYLAKKQYGGTIRLGAWECELIKDTQLQKLYKDYSTQISENNIVEERHRHRYEVNQKFIAQLEDSGLVFSGKSPDGKLMEAIELPKDVHPFFMATQYHPEYISRPLEPHPIFIGFIEACIK